VAQLVGVDDRSDDLHGAVGDLQAEDVRQAAIRVEDERARLAVDLDLADLQVHLTHLLPESGQQPDHVVPTRDGAPPRGPVPAAVPGIAFLSGGQSDEEATAHLDAMNRTGVLPWRLTFSYGRALQAAPQKAWSGKPENVAAGQRAFSHRARMNALASRGQWETGLEKKVA